MRSNHHWSYDPISPYQSVYYQQLSTTATYISYWTYLQSEDEPQAQYVAGSEHEPHGDVLGHRVGALRAVLHHQRQQREHEQPCYKYNIPQYKHETHM